MMEQQLKAKIGMATPVEISTDCIYCLDVQYAKRSLTIHSMCFYCRPYLFSDMMGQFSPQSNIQQPLWVCTSISMKQNLLLT